MAVVVGKGSFRGFADSTRSTDEKKAEWTPEQHISNNLQAISRNTQQLKKMVDSIGTSMDSRDLRRKLGVLQSETNELTKHTNLAIKKYEDDPSFDDAQLKERTIQHRRFKESFHDILKEYNDLQKIIRAKERESLRKSLMKSGCYDIDIDERGELIKDGEHIQVEAIQAEIDLDLIKEREQDLKQLEQDICDINDIFKDLAGMVAEQGEIIAEAEDNVDVAVLEVETGLVELEKAENNVRSSRKKTFILAAVITTIVLIIITVILAVQFS
ncbi:syntaxin-12-like [Mercenaria mercenaria]|uniref:syntaxin-12-like n=1 Tax=Mercenaria mercenaria TaxID=6596 RepID=UPI00234F60EC|nr:syntaxin-12-like [Mercenaria mercenaria]